MGILPFPEEKWAGRGGGRKGWEERKEGKFGLDVKTDKQRGGAEPSLHHLFTALTGGFSKVCFPELTLEAVTQHSAGQLQRWGSKGLESYLIPFHTGYPGVSKTVK